MIIKEFSVQLQGLLRLVTLVRGFRASGATHRIELAILLVGAYNSNSSILFILLSEHPLRARPNNVDKGHMLCFVDHDKAKRSV